MLQKSEQATGFQPAPFPLRFFEFVSLIALFMAITALSIDIMLPALPDIGLALSVEDENSRQLVISFYFIGFALGQFLFGPISDRFGRKRPLLIGLGIYIVGTLLALGSFSFHGLLAARILQGVGAAAPRVIALAIVRDRFEGREMARVMSFVMMVFIVVPILAPGLGEGILQLSTWRAIFSVLLIAAATAMLWALFRLPETQHRADRIPLSASAIWQAVKLVATTRQTLGYIVGMGFVFGLMMSYIISAEQVFVGVYGLGARFPIFFGGIACFMIAASIVNAFTVRKLGMRVLSHLALLGALLLCVAFALAGYPAKPSLLLFCAFMAGVFFCFGLIMPNFNSLSMEPMSHIAGTASSIGGFYSTASAAIFGTVVGQSFDGTVRPLCMGITILLVAALATVLVTERFRLARPSSRPAVKVPAIEP
jgi:DHA1 family bicyclomycin/chloramphenicol resistance-like MFS transporter